MKRRGFTLVELLVVVAVILVFTAMIVPIFRRAAYNSRPSYCQSNLKQVGLGVMQYTQDYSEHFPIVATGGTAYGWADALQPYLKSTQLYQCPDEIDRTSGTDPRAPSYTDYWYNANLSGRKLEDVEYPALQIEAGDGNDGIDRTNARYAKARFPTTWLQDHSSPAYRHYYDKEGMNFLFADGHVKYYTARNLTPNEQHVGLTMRVPTPTPTSHSTPTPHHSQRSGP